MATQRSAKTSDMFKVHLIDGGFSTQLSKYVGPIIDGDPLWTSRFLVTDNEKCIRAHQDFIRAGADIITSGSYQANITDFKTYLGLDQEEALSVIKHSISLVREAVSQEKEESGKRENILIAGSVGPYGVALHDGSEYKGDYGMTMTKEELMDWHRPKVEALIEGNPDLLAFETIPCSKEALALVEILKENPHSQAWISFSGKDSQHISSGESFQEAVSKVWEAGSEQLVAVGVNCLHPLLVTPLMNNLKNFSPSKPLIAYPNSGETYDGVSKRWNPGQEVFDLNNCMRNWLDFGITYVGGCCRTDDKIIHNFANIIKKWYRENKR